MATGSRENQQIEALVIKAQRGNVKAFSKLYEMFVDGIFRFALFKTSSVEQAQDITSETFTKVWRYLSRYKSDNFKAYLFSIARNTIIDFYKKKSKRYTQSTDNLDWMAANTKDLTSELIKQESQQQLYQAIGQLPASYQEIVTLRYIEELSVKETAEIVKKTEVSVRVTQHRAVNQLKEILTKQNQAKENDQQ